MRLLTVNKYHRVFGGGERYISELTHLLERRGHEVIPFAMADPQNEPSPYAGYFVSPIEFFDKYHQPKPWAIAERVIYSQEARSKISQLIEAVKPDLAHIHNIYHYISPSILDALHEHQIPVVMTLHDYKLICPTYSLWTKGEICERCGGKRFYHCVLQRCNHGSLLASGLNTIEAYIHRAINIYSKVGLFVSPSQFLRQKHIEYGLTPQKIVHIPNFLNISDYTPEFGHKDYVIYAGRLTPFKGVNVLLEAMSKLRPSTPLIIAGDGPIRDDLEEKSQQLRLDNVHFLGHISGTRLRDLIAQAAFAIVPSAWYENCSYAVLEALALGTPVLATDIGGIPELVDDGINGLLVPPNNVDALAEGLRHLLENRNILPKMGENGRKYIEKTHNEETHFAALSHVYVRAGLSKL
jgi:glycosyltransferase involved in cell wall biosynthesis